MVSEVNMKQTLIILCLILLFGCVLEPEVIKRTSMATVVTGVKCGVPTTKLYFTWNVSDEKEGVTFCRILWTNTDTWENYYDFHGTLCDVDACSYKITDLGIDTVSHYYFTVQAGRDDELSGYSNIVELNGVTE